jgi:NAD(P)-dependent dehydrogenase (short-subunit alcohol dehydrogenase family)
LGGSVPERALRLAGKIAVVTGGGSGLGRAIALGLGREGADVALSFHSSGTGAQEVKDALAAAGRRAHLGLADASRPGDIGRFVNEAAAALGGIDVLVNNVGVFRRIPLDEITDGALDEAFAVNVKAAVMATQAAAPHMRRRGGGSVVNIASLGGIRPWKSYLPYCATKAALIMATECLALALAPDIRVNAVAPGVLDPPGATDAVRERIPQERFGSLEEAVESVLFLATGARYTTGEVFRVDGGRALA